MVKYGSLLVKNNNNYAPTMPIYALFRSCRLHFLSACRSDGATSNGQPLLPKIVTTLPECKLSAEDQQSEVDPYITVKRIT